jgi:uncharacterized protein with GYD domain
MPKFLLKATYSTEGAKGVSAKGGSARRDAIARLFNASGGNLESFHFAFGETDAYVIGDLPDIETATAVALTVNGTGSATVETVVLLTPEQVDAAAQKSIDYAVPGS